MEINMQSKGGDLLIVAAVSKYMAAVSPQAQHFPTPSPFSVASSTARPPTQIPNLILRLLTLVLAFVAALAIAITPKRKGHRSFDHISQLMYCFVVSILVFIYSAYQLFKGVCDISHRGIAIPDKISDYLTFLLDQLMAYLLISSSSLGLEGITKTQKGSPLREAAIVSVTMSFAIFLVIAASAILSGYKLCKRIMW